MTFSTAASVGMVANIRIADGGVFARPEVVKPARPELVKPVRPSPPPPPPPPAPRYRETERVVDQRLRFTFDPALHGYVFEGIGTIVPGASRGLQRTQVTWNGRPHSYYQHDRSRNVFYYLPDTFKIARRPDAPHRPLVSVRFDAQDGTREALSVTVTYCAVPVVRRERLLEALPTLRGMVPPEILATAPLQLEPLLADSALRLRLSLPGVDAAHGPFAERPGAAADMRAGIVDAVSGLSLDQFRGVFDAMLSQGQLLFTGDVSFQSGGIVEEIPFQLRLHDTAEPRVRWTVAPDRTTVTITNTIESPLEVRRLMAVLGDGAASAMQPLEPAEGALPLEIPPGGAGRFRIPAGQTLAEIDLSDVDTLPAKDVVFNLLLDPTTRPEYRRPIKVKVFPPTFAAPADDPARQVLAIFVDFEDGTTVELSPTQLEVPVDVPVPVLGFVLGTESRQTYRYKVTVVRLNGPATDAEWRTGESGILVPPVV
jgi:hypothetical protein